MQIQYKKNSYEIAINNRFVANKNQYKKGDPGEANWRSIPPMPIKNKFYIYENHSHQN